MSVCAALPQTAQIVLIEGQSLEPSLVLKPVTSLPRASLLAFSLEPSF